MATSQNSETSSCLVKDSVTSPIKSAGGTLVSKLHSACDVTCEKFVSSIKFSMLKKLFRPIYEKNSEALKNLHTQLCSHLRESIREELGEICKKHSVDFLLNSLEELNKNQDPSQPSWRPSGNPEDDLRDHLYPCKVKQKEALQSMLHSLQMSNEELVNNMEINHAEIMHIKRKNDDLQEEFSNIITVNEANLENLRTTMENTLEKL